MTLYDDNGAATGQVTDHATEGLTVLLEQDKEATLFRAWIASYLTPLDDVETAAWYAFTMRDVDNAEGVWLDELGELLGLGRRGATDAEYRPLLRAQIAANRSKGQPADFFSVLEALFPAGTYRLAEYPPPSVKVTLDDVLTVPRAFVLELLRRAKAAGVSLAFEHTYLDAASASAPSLVYGAAADAPEYDYTPGGAGRSYEGTNNPGDHTGGGYGGVTR